MEFGSFVEFPFRNEFKSQAEVFEEAFAHVDMAEELGLDAVWVAEHHFVNRFIVSAPLVMASAIAARTKRMKVGTAILVLPLNHPLRIAEEVATLDHITQGRLQFGVGRSALPQDFEPYNLNFGQSRDRFLESLDIILGVWTNERFSFQGRYFSFDDVCVAPKPYQIPHPPIRIAANTSETFRLIGRMGFPIFLGVRTLPLSQVVEYVQIYKREWKNAGHQGPIDMCLRVPVYVAETKEKALSEPEKALMLLFQRLGEFNIKSAARLEADAKKEREARGRELINLTWEQARRERVAVGTPEMVIERLQEMKEALDLSSMLIEFTPGDPTEGYLIPRENAEKSLRLFCEKVLPAFK